MGALLGKVVISVLKLEKTKHTLVYGLFAYFTGVFILSGPFTFLHLHWNLYFFTITAYNIVIMGLLLYALYKKIIKVSFSFNSFIRYCKDNYLVLGMIVFFIFMNFGSDNTLVNDRVGWAAGDDVYYLSWATKNVGHSIYPLGLNLWVGLGDKYEFLTLIAFFELFWGYMQQAFNIDLVVFVRTTLPIVMYVWFFCTFDEVIFAFTDKKKYGRFKYAILSVALLYYANGMQSEVYKFMYNPWFGNVFSLMMYIPLLLLFLRLSLTNKKALYLLWLLPFIASGFSAVSILHAGLTIVPATFLWYRSKTYIVRHEKKVLYISFVMAFIFLLVSSAASWEGVLGKISQPDGLFEILQGAEMFLAQAALKQRLIFILPGIVIFFYRLARKEVALFEKVAILFSLGIAVSVLVPFLDTAVFLVFGFPYRRVAESYMLALVFYSGAMLLLCVRKVGLKQLLGIFLICSFVFYSTNGFYLHPRFIFSKQVLRNLVREKRFDPTVVALEDFLVEHGKETKNETTYVCVFDGRIKPIDSEDSVDVGLSIAPVPETYYNCNLSLNKEVTRYYVTTDAGKLFSELGREHFRFVKKIETDRLTLEVYEYMYV